MSDVLQRARELLSQQPTDVAALAAFAVNHLEALVAVAEAAGHVFHACHSLSRDDEWRVNYEDMDHLGMSLYALNGGSE